MSHATPFETFGIWAVVAVSVAALGYAIMLVFQVLRRDSGTPAMQEIALAIRTGAQAYLRRQFRAILVLIALLTIVLYLTAALAGAEWHISVGRAAAFLMGSLFSATVGYVGMSMAVAANVRVASASRRSVTEALRIAYRAGTITGMLTDGLGLLGGTLIFIIYGKAAPEVLLGFGFGGTLLALFMRVGGGIYTKSADVGADLVGKIELGIPEDDPRNAAAIADLVGDNVGDCAGMAADVFESYEVTMVSAMILGLALQPFDLKWIVFPLLVRGIGVVSSIIGTYAVTVWPTKDAFKAMDWSYDLSSLLSTISFAFLAHFYVGDWRVFWSTFAGILLAIGFNKYTAYFTHTDHAPVQQIARSTRTGAATTILAGLGIGFESTVWAILIIAIAILVSVLIFAGSGVSYVLYSVALCGIGMLSQTGNNVSMDAFGPIADNANGIGEMSGMEAEARSVMATLDAVGNTTKAITKGIAIASAVIASVSLFGSFITDINVVRNELGLSSSGNLSGINIASPIVFVGMLVGGAVPFLFSSLSIRAVERGATAIADEVRRQFSNAGLVRGEVKPDYERAVVICTTAAQKELVGMGLLAVLTPVVVGLLLGAESLGAFLGGVILVGQLLAVFMANAGGAWDNAKKVIEEGKYGGLHSPAHQASVVGDTVGDPLKDTAGPALNPMIKVINLVSVIVAPLVVRITTQADQLWIGYALGAIGLVILGIVVWRSKREN